MENVHNEFLEKETPVDYKIYPLLKERWSPRVFADTPVSEIDLYVLFEAGRWAPSSYNMQPWRIIWGTKGSDTYDRIFNCLDTFNQSWAHGAPVLLITAYKKTNPKGKENFHALHDLGLFMGNLTIQAQSMGIAVHQMAGVNHEKAVKEFKFPEEYHVASGAAIGFYGGNPENLPNDLKEKELKKERVRKPQEEFIFNGDFVQRAEVDDSDG